MATKLLWLVILGCMAGIAVWLWKARKRIAERQATEEARMASFVAQAAAPRAAAASSTPEETMLFEAAAKAAQAGEPALSIQLYARLIARFPDGALGAQARAAVAVQKKSLVIARAPGTSAQG